MKCVTFFILIYFSFLISATELTVMLNSSVALPCYPTHQMEGSAALIVLWYKDENPEPFYR